MTGIFLRAVFGLTLVLCFFSTADSNGPQTGTPRALGFKSVRRLGGAGPLVAGNTVRWTIDYINVGEVDIPNFQVRDVVQEYLILISDSNQVNEVSGGSTASRNPGYDGIGDDATSDLLAPGAVLTVGGRIRIILDTVITQAPSSWMFTNQSIGTGTGVVGPIFSDCIDSTNNNIWGHPGSPPYSILQPQDPATLGPTRFFLDIDGIIDAHYVPIEGRVVSTTGRGLKDARVTLRNTSLVSGLSENSVTNSFGYYRFPGALTIGLWELKVRHKRYDFPTSWHQFYLNALNPSDTYVPPMFVGTPR